MVEASIRRILQAAILAVWWGSAGALAMTNEIAQSAAEKPTDVQLQTAIEGAMRTSPLTANSLIVVHVNQGEVTLEGTAMNSLAQREATRLAETVLGVKGIRNRLSVVNSQTAIVPADK
jgi:osmotically-inducible protein OsmY